EDPGERALQDVAVLEDVAHARRAPQIVLENVELPRSIAHQIGPRDVAPDPARGLQAHALRPKIRARLDELLGDDLVAQDALLAVDVGDEEVERLDPLAEPGFEAVPLLTRHDARNDVERKDALGAAVLADKCERDPHAEKRAFGGGLARAENPGLESANA